jgi:RNA polymerase sigma-70 factor (ECF subfamily)
MTAWSYKPLQEMENLSAQQNQTVRRRKSMVDQTDLLQRARRFEEAALADIYDQFSDDLYRYAMRLLGDQNLAEDCVAETFSRFLQALQRGGGPREHLRAYLYRVAHNWITDHYRRKEIDPKDLLREEASVEAVDPSQIVHAQLEVEKVRQALQYLTDDQRQVIMLKFLQGWSNQEIAATIQKPVGAVKSLQHRGLAALKRVLLREETTT